MLPGDNVVLAVVAFLVAIFCLGVVLGKLMKGNQP